MGDFNINAIDQNSVVLQVLANYVQMVSELDYEIF